MTNESYVISLPQISSLAPTEIVVSKTAIVPVGPVYVNVGGSVSMRKESITGETKVSGEAKIFTALSSVI